MYNNNYNKLIDTFIASKRIIFHESNIIPSAKDEEGENDERSVFDFIDESYFMPSMLIKLISFFK
jgi:hypothetical protein